MYELTVLFTNLISRIFTSVVRDPHRTAFRHYDQNRSGRLDREQVRTMVADLRAANDVPNLTDEQFKLFWELADADKNGSLGLQGVKEACGLLHIDVREFLVDQWKARRCPAARALSAPSSASRRAQFFISIGLFIFMLALNVFLFWAVYGCDEWTITDSFYFSVMTMLTIGLGDFVPAGFEDSSRCWWRVWLSFLSLFSLGSATLFISALSNWITNSRKQEMRRANKHAFDQALELRELATHSARRSTVVLEAAAARATSMAVWGSRARSRVARQRSSSMPAVVGEENDSSPLPSPLASPTASSGARPSWFSSSASSRSVVPINSPVKSRTKSRSVSSEDEKAPAEGAVKPPEDEKVSHEAVLAGQTA